MYAPYCKACKAFGVKFRKLATDKGDRINAVGEVVQPGDARFGELDYASNIKLCKELGVNKFPTVLIFRGGEDDNIQFKDQLLSEITCKQKDAVEEIVTKIDQLVLSSY